MKTLYAILATAVIAGGIYYFTLPTKPECQKEVTCFDKKAKNDELIKKAQKLIKEGSVRYSCKIIKSKYMKSEITSYVDEAKLLEISKKAFGEETGSKEFLEIECRLYENDKEDPGKKSDSSKLFAGYLLYDFLIDGKSAYRIQIDFTNMQGRDIPKRVDCIKKSLFAL